MKLRSLAALMLVALMVTAGHGIPQTTAQSTPTGGDVRQVDLPHGRAISLSPDGALLSAYDRDDDSLCVYAVETMAQVSCADLTAWHVPVRVGDIVWSPDSTRLAFGQDAFVLMRDSDLWVMDAQTGALTNLTDDGFDDSILPSAGTSDFFVDIAPAWSPDGQALTFSRTIGIDGDFSGNMIAQIPAEGGEVETLAAVSPILPGVFYIRGGWSPDGATFFYNVGTPDRDDPQNGIWALDAASGDTRQLASTDDPELGALALRQVSPTGDRLLAYYPLSLAGGYIGKSVQRFVDPQTGEISPIPDPVPESEIFQGSWFGAFSPDGQYLLQPNGIGGTFDYWVTELTTGVSTEVATGLERALPVDGILSPVWASNGVAGVARDVTGAYLFPIDGAGLGQSSPAAATPIASPGAGTSSDAEVRLFELPEGRAVSMSPDGTKLAALVPPSTSLCVYDVATETEISCADLTVLNSGIRVDDIVWSPDSTRLAFGEDSFLYFKDGDLWVMDAQSGALTDLTDDHYDGAIAFLAEGDDDAAFSVEVSPAWTPDSQFITFSSSQFDGNEQLGNVIAQLPADGSGDLEILTQVSTETLGVVYYGTGWSPDGASFYYTVTYPDLKNPDNGIWVYDKASGETRQLAVSDDPELGPLALRQVSPAGDRLLAYYPIGVAQMMGRDQSMLRFVDPATGALSPVPEPDGGTDGAMYTGTWIATFSPNGQDFLQLTGADASARDAWVTNLATGESTLAATDLEDAVPIEYGRGPVWGSNDLVFVSHNVTGTYFFPVEGSGSATTGTVETPATPLASPEADSSTADSIVGGPVQRFDLDEGRAVNMSPDGQFVAVVQPPGGPLCVYTAATMEQVSCADTSVLNAGIRTEDIVWSPDSTRLAFSENVFRYFADGDLWVMDARTGALTDLTDDGYDGKVLIGADEGVTYYADVAPAWTPDSQSITFSRTTFDSSGNRGNTLAQIPASGGEVETLATISAEEPGVYYFRGGWSPDGTRFFYNVAHADSGDPENGIWVYDPSTGESSLFATAEADDLGPLAFREISADGSHIIGWYPLGLGQFGSGSESFLRFVDPETGALSALPDPTPESDDPAGSWIVTFSPDGAYLLQATGTDNNALDFWATNLATGATTLVASDLEQAVPIDYQLGPVWGSNGVVFVSHSIAGVYLFSIEGAGLDGPVTPPVEASPVASPASNDGTLAVGSDAVTTGIAPIYAGPDTESPMVVFLPPDHVVRVLAEPVENDEGIWIPIFDPQSQIIGYVEADRLAPLASDDQ